MADVTGPISTLPGSSHSVPDGVECDDHPGRKAVARVQGETDSFGSEMIDLCAECLADHRAYEKTRDRSGKCDWCKQQAERLTEARDYDEGMHGRVYDVCGPCLDKRDREIREELDRYDDRWGPLE